MILCYRKLWELLFYSDWIPIVWLINDSYISCKSDTVFVRCDKTFIKLPLIHNFSNSFKFDFDHTQYETARKKTYIPQ